ncbi:MAG: tRNA-dihydrouridine synthase, partial [Bacteroidota bacterium]|nr:tRNA-dihydrouridine synthase [Bacteroidota bacterium]
GDITGPVQAKEFHELSGVDALMIGRASIGRPWIFQEIKHYFQTGELLPAPTVPEIVTNVKDQLTQSVSWKDDERRAIFEMRRHFARYFPNLPGFKDLRIALLQAVELPVVLALLDTIAERYHDHRVDYSNVGLN